MANTILTQKKLPKEKSPSKPEPVKIWSTLSFRRSTESSIGNKTSSFSCQIRRCFLNQQFSFLLIFTLTRVKKRHQQFHRLWSLGRHALTPSVSLEPRRILRSLFVVANVVEVEEAESDAALILLKPTTSSGFR